MANFSIKPIRTAVGYDYRKSEENTLVGVAEYNDITEVWEVMPYFLNGNLKRYSMKRDFYSLEAAEYFILALAIEEDETLKILEARQEAKRVG